MTDPKHHSRLLPASGDAAADTLDLRSFRSAIRRNFRLMVGIVGLAVAIAGIATWWQDPVFESETTLQFEGHATNDRLGALTSLAGLGSLGRDLIGPVATAIPVLTSRKLAESVVDSLGLHVLLLEPAVSRDNMLRVVSAPREVVPGEYLLERDGATSYRLRASDGSYPESTVTLDQEFRVGDVRMMLRPDLAGAPPERIRFAVRQFRAAVADLRKELQVSPAGAQVVSVRYRSGDPLLAATVPNALAATFIQYTAEISATESLNTVGFLRDQVATYEAQLRAAEAELQRFREEARVVSLPHELSGQAGRLADLQVRRDEILAERQALSDLLARAEGGATTDPGPYRQLASFPVFFSNGAVQGILQALTQLENRRADLMVLRTPENEDVRAVNGRIEELERQLYETARSYLQSRETQLASLESTLAQFSQDVREVPQREIEVARLARQAKLLEEIYAMVHTRLKEAEIRNAAEPTGLRVLDPALVPQRPLYPRPLINLGLSIVLGLIVAGGVVFLREVTDTRIRDERDLQLSGTGLPLLGAIPLHQTPRARLSLPVVRGAGKVIASATGPLVTRTAPFSTAAEAYRALRTSIALSTRGSGPGNVIVFASAMPGDGKSTIVANLCVSCVQQGIRTLLIDCDLREGRLHELLEIPPGPGLSDVLIGQLSAAAALREISIDDAPLPLHFVSAGRHGANLVEVIDPRKMRDLLAELKPGYQLIVIDTPPLQLVADAAAIAAAGDMTILVAREGTTDKEVLYGIAAQLQQLGVSLGGLVLNGKTEFAGSRNYGGYANGREAATHARSTQVS